jgi:hypothetical protein
MSIEALQVQTSTEIIVASITNCKVASPLLVTLFLLFVKLSYKIKTNPPTCPYISEPIVIHVNTKWFANHYPEQRLKNLGCLYCKHKYQLKSLLGARHICSKVRVYLRTLRWILIYFGQGQTSFVVPERNKHGTHTAYLLPPITAAPKLCGVHDCFMF